MTATTKEIDAPLRIEDYGLIGDCKTAALVGRNGSIDWLCWPRFDSGACCAALLGDSENGRWSIRPDTPSLRTSRRYRGDTLVLETLFETEKGSFALVDFMPVGRLDTSVVRIVEGRTGRVPVRMHLTLRFDYGASVPWVTHLPDENGVVAIAGPNLVVLRTTVDMHGEDLSTVADFNVDAGERIAFVMSHGPSHREAPAAFDAEEALVDTTAYWTDWAGLCTQTGPHRDAVVRSLLTLKAMAFAETGGIVAAPTASLPEKLGGTRNWDYRYCWVRDATLTLGAMMSAGYFDEAKAWRDWLQRAVAGTPDALQVMYGLSGERRLDEWVIPWLPGYQGASPVRIGNAAAGQLQLDVWGEIMDALHVARAGGLACDASAWSLQSMMLEHLASIWDKPDDGIWEVRGGRRQFTHSKVMAWVAFDRGVRDAETFDLKAPLARWRAIRDDIHRTVCEHGYHPELDSFTKSFGSRELDASLLLIPIYGFLPIDDSRVRGTIAAIERDLVRDGLVLRYRTEAGTDGLPSGEGAFLACSLWLADAYQMQGRFEEADALFARVMSLRNDLGLLSEEYDTGACRQVGNFPQAFSHLALVRTAIGVGTRARIRARLDPQARSLEAEPARA